MLKAKSFGELKKFKVSQYFLIKQKEFKNMITYPYKPKNVTDLGKLSTNNTKTIYSRVMDLKININNFIKFYTIKVSG
ncbi:hypothetical protein LBC_10600 [Campylobacter sp. 19-13652]|nr:hypothetical protein LBC_10600 [Campylobacter sp. 19-13652]